ncbi:hypothetical protein [Breoghania sp.]|uniref:hypothetical protein n=1 Tax=Breoghania sp. TaxID=2065378 RepID=UPI00263713D6|nr:hypothetical protein [Breoghania sp.]MDJ0933527.1 hypothetical protein [Breoghania sp.]
MTTGATAFTGYDPLDFVVQFDATKNTVGVEMGILNADLATQLIETRLEGSPEFGGVGSFEFAFGQGVQYEDYEEDSNPQNGGSAYVDNDTYAAVENPNKVRNSLNYWDTSDYLNDQSYGQSEDTASQNYFISGNAVPEADAGLFRSADNPTAPVKCTCEFMHWDYWRARLETDATGEDAIDFDTDGKRTDYFHLATWVAGDLPDTDTTRDLGTATATYSGHAVGNVERIDGSQTSRCLATGALGVN